MPRVLLTSLLATVVAAQAEYAIDRYRYIGCVEASPGTFGYTVDFFAPFTSADCQGACAGRGSSGSFAALSGGCGCSIPGQDPRYTVVDESRCNHLCIEGDETGGYCGGDGVYTLFQKKRQDEARKLRGRQINLDDDTSDIVDGTDDILDDGTDDILDDGTDDILDDEADILEDETDILNDETDDILDAETDDALDDELIVDELPTQPVAQDCSAVPTVTVTVTECPSQLPLDIPRVESNALPVDLDSAALPVEAQTTTPVFTYSARPFTPIIEPTSSVYVSPFDPEETTSTVLPVTTNGGGERATANVLLGVVSLVTALVVGMV